MPTTSLLSSTSMTRAASLSTTTTTTTTQCMATWNNDYNYKEGYRNVAARGDRSYKLYYRIYHYPRDQQQQEQADDTTTSETPILVVLHGGPSLPSQYLYPIVDHVTGQRRPILFYDQLGCGKSDEPRDKKLYSVDLSVEDLHNLLESLHHLPSKKIHLLGHSYGGVVAVEYVRRFPQTVQSLILSNAPTSMKLALSEYDRLYSKNPRAFWKTHACRTEETPPALADAMKHLGTVWGGMNVVVDYVAEPFLHQQETVPPTLLIRGEYDFGQLASQNWTQVLGSDALEQQVLLEGCAHYPHLENGAAFGRLVTEFCDRHDDSS